MRKRSSKRTEDMNEAAFRIMAESVGDRPATADESSVRRAAAALLGSLGGKKGGPARAKALSAAKRKAIAKTAAAARWKKS